MTGAISHNLDYVAARLHGRRSQMAEAQRLESLCRLRAVSELSLARYPGIPALPITILQQRLVEDLVRELEQLLDYLPKPGAAMLEWMIARFEVENLKILVRARGTHQSLDDHLLVRVPAPQVIDAVALSGASTLQELIQQMPQGLFRTTLEKSAAQPQPFFMEAALDRVYFGQLLQRLADLDLEDREAVGPLVFQEVDLWQTMLLLRGKFAFGLSADALIPLHLKGTRLSHNDFVEMGRAQDYSAVVARISGKAVDSVTKTPADLSSLEIAGWKRFLRLANQAFRRGPAGLGTIIGYAALRRMEVANLITISEGIRVGIGGERLCARLVT